MIRLHKGPPPPVLAANAQTWTEDLLQEVDAGGDKVAYRKSKYNHPEIKDALRSETYRKCAYCESQPLHVTYGDIEHIIPKSTDLQLTFDWQNLTLACDVCNTKKGDHEGILDPYNCTPSDELEFIGPMLMHKEGRAAAEITKIRLDLNRMDLLARRADRLDELENNLRRISQHADATERALMLEAAIDHAKESERAYCACGEAFLRAKDYTT